MTTLQIVGVSALALVFFGSIGLGRYLRWRDEKAANRPPRKPR